MDYTHYYKKFHSDTKDHTTGMYLYYKLNLKHQLPSQKDATILDVGCGSGIFLSYLSQLGYKNIKGVDIDKGQADACKAKGLDVVHVENTVEYLNSHALQFDYVFCFDVIEHIVHESQIEFVKSLHNCLKNNGILICSVPNANSPLASRWRYNDWTHHCSFTEHSLDFLLYHGGFGHIEIYPMEFPSKNIIKHILKMLIHVPMRFFNRLQLISELGMQGLNIPLSLNILAKATKQ